MRVLLVAGVLALAGCAVDAVPATGEPAVTSTSVVADGYAALDEARGKWAAVGFDSYHYEFENDCGECGPLLSAPREVVVWDADRFDPVRSSPSVEQMFDEIEAALDEGLNTDVVYDEELGYPVEVDIDGDSRPVDGGIRWLVHTLEPGLPGDDVSLSDISAAEQLWKAKRPDAYEYTLTVWCDCPLNGSVVTRIDGDRIVSYDILYDESLGGSITPIAVDDMFSDLEDLMASVGGVVEDGIRFTGSARFDPLLGYPVWVGLDIEVLRDDPVLEELPTRLVVTMTDLRPIDVDRAAGQVELSALEEAVGRWAAAGVDTYSYELTIHAMATADYTGPFAVEIIDGEIVSVTRDGSPVSPEVAAGYRVEQIFDMIREAIAGDVEVAVLYNQVLGYPVLVQIDLGAIAVDGGLSFSLDQFEAVDG
jgi:hypothetical protein